MRKYEVETSWSDIQRENYIVRPKFKTIQALLFRLIVFGICMLVYQKITSTTWKMSELFAFGIIFLFFLSQKFIAGGLNNYFSSSFSRESIKILYWVECGYLLRDVKGTYQRVKLDDVSSLIFDDKYCVVDDGKQSFFIPSNKDNIELINDIKKLSKNIINNE